MARSNFFIFRKRTRGSWRRRLLGVMAGLAAGILGYWWWTYRGPQDPVEIYRGVTYSCERLPEEEEGGGLFYLVQINLTAPGIELYTTPLDQKALSQGWEYRLKYVSSVVKDENLAVGVNGNIFSSDSGLFYMPGDFAKNDETMVSEYKIDHYCCYCWLLYFDNNLIPHVRTPLGPTAKVFTEGRWAIGTQCRMLIDGKYWGSHGDTIPDARTCIAYNTAKKLLWLACFKRASYRYAAKILLARGATDAVGLDGGTSTSLAIGRQAKHVWSGTAIGGWRPVMNCFGVKAQPLP